jgi:hypothetical protein
MLVTMEGIYRDGKVELTEAPAGVKEARVLVTFLTPVNGEAQAAKASAATTETQKAAEREAALNRLFALMEKGFDLGGPPYPKREEL